jgi:hypothetical protein
MYSCHKFMEVQSFLLQNGEMIIEHIGKETFPTATSSMQIDPAQRIEADC